MPDYLGYNVRVLGTHRSATELASEDLNKGFLLLLGKQEEKSR
ncbi:hypothetical protein [Hymenobacter cellulosivorans]|nr:hypothetical protein [Hymenobacter cellulosivorans]